MIPITTPAPFCSERVSDGLTTTRTDWLTDAAAESCKRWMIMFIVDMPGPMLQFPSRLFSVRSVLVQIAVWWSFSLSWMSGLSSPGTTSVWRNGSLRKRSFLCYVRDELFAFLSLTSELLQSEPMNEVGCSFASNRTWNRASLYGAVWIKVKFPMVLLTDWLSLFIWCVSMDD